MPSARLWNTMICNVRMMENRLADFIDRVLRTLLLPLCVLSCLATFSTPCTSEIIEIAIRFREFQQRKRDLVFRSHLTRGKSFITEIWQRGGSSRETGNYGTLAEAIKRVRGGESGRRDLTCTSEWDLVLVVKFEIFFKERQIYRCPRDEERRFYF